MPLTEVQWLYWIDDSVLSDTPPEPVLHHPETGSEKATSDEPYSLDDDVGFRERGMCVYNDGISHSVFSVVQADKEFPDCQHLRDAILDKFKKSVFTRKTFKGVKNAN